MATTKGFNPFNKKQTKVIALLDDLSEISKMSKEQKKLFDASQKIVGKSEVYEEFTSKQWDRMYKLFNL